MRSSALGKSTSVEVTNISSHGIWLLADEQELFMSYDDFPWFKDVSVSKVFNVEEPQPGHFYWPDLDIDLTAEIIAHPERFPPEIKVTHNTSFVRTSCAGRTTRRYAAASV